MVSLDAVTVLTTPERKDAFSVVFGANADYRFDYRQTMPLSDFLGNLAVGGGAIAVLDESHFISSSSMLRGIRSFTNDARWRDKQLRLIVVCLNRSVGDTFLTELVACCGVYDIVYGVDWTEAIVELGRMLERPSDRFDVLELMPQMPSECPEPETIHKLTTSEHETDEQALLCKEFAAQGGISIKITVSREI